MKGITCITIDNDLRHKDSDGFYDIIKHHDSFKFEGKKYKYHASGLCRSVYLSDCGKFVIKVAGADSVDFDPNSKDFKYLDPRIHHNYYEAIAYAKCPDKYKKYLAKTELLPNCWIRQEFVNVIETYTGRHDFREIGQREDKSFCIFDYDPLLDDYRFDGCNWPRLPILIEQGIKGIKPA